LGCLYSDQVYRQRVNEHVEGGKRSGVRGTPTFFVNDALVDGSSGFDRVVRAVAGGLWA
jgi:protein-disulfide isomerase